MNCTRCGANNNTDSCEYCGNGERVKGHEIKFKSTDAGLKDYFMAALVLSLAIVFVLVVGIAQ